MTKRPNRIALMYRPFNADLIDSLEKLGSVTVDSFVKAFGYRWPRHVLNGKNYTHFFLFHSSEEDIMNAICIAKLSGNDANITVVDDKVIVSKYRRAVNVLEKSSNSEETHEKNKLILEISSIRSNISEMKDKILDLERQKEKMTENCEILEDNIANMRFSKLWGILGK